MNDERIMNNDLSGEKDENIVSSLPQGLSAIWLRQECVIRSFKNNGSLDSTITPHFREAQFLNASASIAMTDNGILIIRRWTQFANEPYPTVFTELSGIDIVKRFPQSKNEYGLITLMDDWKQENLMLDAWGNTMSSDRSGLNNASDSITNRDILIQIISFV